jgi:DNA-binding transcriptional regulator LsrR (DeoR family)
MLVVETVAKIRRLHLGQGKATKEICRKLGLSRKAVRRVLRSGATEFRYERKRGAGT